MADMSKEKSKKKEESLGDVFKAIRDVRDLSLRDMAKKLNMTHSNIAHLEKGETANAQTYILRLKKELSLTLEERQKIVRIYLRDRAREIGEVYEN